MVMLVGMLTTLLLGFVLGRIWQIRQQLVLTEHQRTRQHSVERRVANQGAERSQTIDRKPLVSSHRPNEEVPAAPASALHFRSSPAAFAGRFRALHQSLQHVGGSAL
jgi:hypothetical protein